MFSIRTVLIVGLGSIGKRHLRILKKQYPSIRLVVLRHKQCEETNIKEFGLIACATNISQALEFKPDVAIIATPATKHMDTALILADNGVHLLIEKPISAVSIGIQPLIDLCLSKKIVLMTAYNLRFQPALKEFRKLIAKNRIGDILTVKAEVGQFLPNWRPDSDYKKGVSAQKKLGGGVILELSHEIDYLSWVFGDYKWVRAHISKQSNLDIDVEDSANILFGIDSDKGNEIVVSLNMDFIRHDNTRQCIAIGNQGSLRWDAITGEVYLFKKNSQKWELVFSKDTGRNYTYEKEIEHFFSSIREGKDVLITGKDGLKTVQVIDAIRQSHQSNCMVML
jgi:predicted dehydrogenase